MRDRRRHVARTRWPHQDWAVGAAEQHARKAWENAAWTADAHCNAVLGARARVQWEFEFTARVVRHLRSCEVCWREIAWPGQTAARPVDWMLWATRAQVSGEILRVLLAEVESRHATVG